MRRQDFSYDLPDELIAAEPCAERTASRLLCMASPSGELEHKHFSDVLDQVNAGDLMVFNNTKVIPARLFGTKATGGKLEILVERVLDRACILAHIRASKSPKVGAQITLENGVVVTMIARHDALFELDFGKHTVLDVLDAVGHMPLPPYIEREDTLDDKTRYQTVYGEVAGAVAAPTAGLHFDQALLTALKDKGVNIAYVTLHVGAGTFQPVRVDDIHEHTMHSEWMTIDQSVCDAVNQTRAAGGRVIAVGTTSVRSLESAAQRSEHFEQDQQLMPYQGDTDIFIYPGFTFRIVDSLITNFHLSESTLLMLVSAFAGYRHIMQAYRVAVAERYRFFSYGDAMLLHRNPAAVDEVVGQSSSTPNP